MPVDFAAHVRSVPDFPKPGIVFRDIAPLLRDYLPETISAMVNLLDAKLLADIQYFVGIDARGFIFAPAIAARTEKGFLMARKAGKAPPPQIQKQYSLEYGSATLEVAPGKGSIIIVDDVLATGGTMTATAELCTEAGYTVRGFLALIDLQFLNSFSWQGLQAQSLIQYAA